MKVRNQTMIEQCLWLKRKTAYIILDRVIRSILAQQFENVHMSIVCCNVQWCPFLWTMITTVKEISNIENIEKRHAELITGRDALVVD